MWALVDCDNFFCSCERVFRPDLNARPVVVLSNNDGCVVARSKEAKALGVRMGIPYYQMLEQFPKSGITAFSSNYRLYADMSARVMAVLRDNTPKLLQYSVDEAFLDLSGLELPSLQEWGEKLAAMVRKWTGIPVSIGIAPTKTLAKVASRFAKKYPGYHKCCIIASDEQRVKALSLTVPDDVWGVGRRISRRLATLGVNTALDFAQKSRAWVKGRFHVPGERTWLELNGYEAIQVDPMEGTVKKSILTSRSFPEMVESLDSLRPHVANFAARCSAKLRRQESVCSVLNVFVQSNFFRDDLPQYACNSIHLFSTPTNTATELVSAAENVLRNIYRPGILYKKAGVMVSELSSAKAIQPDLFEFDSGLSRKYRTLSEAMDEINSRLGADTLILASQQFPERDATGRNIRYAHAIRRALKSPDYSTSVEAFLVAGE
jgi:DNA polymerase V